MCFLVTFCTMQKVTIRSLCREHRGSANLDSARRSCGFAQTKLNPSQRELRGFPNLEAAHPSNDFALTQLNPLPPCGLFFGGLAAFVTFLRKVCPCRDGTLRVLLRRPWRQPFPVAAATVFAASRLLWRQSRQWRSLSGTFPSFL